jgi:hypothetical protein
VQHVPRHRKNQELAQEMIEYTNSQIALLIDEHIHNERNRALLKRRLIEGICFEPLAEEFDISVRQCKSIIYKEQDRLFKHI